MLRTEESSSGNLCREEFTPGPGTAEDTGKVRARLSALLICCIAQCGAEVASTRADNWPRFRGPNGSGISELNGVPTEWTEEDYAWVVTLPGVGHSSPVVWDDALFVTSGTDAVADPGGDTGSRTLFRINAFSGDVEWSREFTLSPDTLHVKNSNASSTPAVDGRHVYLAMADDARYVLHALTFDD